MKIITCAKMKEAEAYAINSGISASRLMENAGSAAARYIRGIMPLTGLRCTVICGCGNNGGDGFVVARRLIETGAQITVVLACGQPRTTDASGMLERLQDISVTILDYNRDRRRCVSLIARSDVIVDAIFGTGFHGRADETMSELFGYINSGMAKVFAIDMPSGANADSGSVEGTCVRADHTITFAAAKTGHFLSPAVGYCGKISVMNIGIPDAALDDGSTAELLDLDYCRRALPVRERSSNKGDYGRVFCLCGSLTMPGAAYMSSTAATRCGAGLITLGVPRCIHAPLVSKLSEVMTIPLEETESGAVSLRAKSRILSACARADAVLIGCGLSLDAETVKLVCELVSSLSCTVVLDADGINAVAQHIDLLRDSKANLILTPHPGEMSRLTGRPTAEIQQSRVDIARSFAMDNGVTLVLKGADTVVSLPDGRVFINPTGNPGMARGGSGDILAGMITGFAAQGLSNESAACCGVYIHGLAGDRCAEKFSQYGMLPTDMFTEIPQIFRDMSR